MAPHKYTAVVGRPKQYIINAIQYTFTHYTDLFVTRCCLHERLETSDPSCSLGELRNRTSSSPNAVTVTHLNYGALFIIYVTLEQFACKKLYNFCYAIRCKANLNKIPQV